MMIPLSMVQLHKAQLCASVCVACRYSVYGCEWKGVRSAVEEHEQSGCVLAKMTGLLEQIRTDRVEHQRNMRERQHQQVSASLMLDALNAIGEHIQVVVAVYDRANPLHVVFLPLRPC